MAKIVIVEDEVLIVYVMQKLLSSSHDIVDIVPDGESAIQAVKRLQPDLIIMDIMLKGELNGIETMEEIRRHSEVPVIYTSAFQLDSTIAKALAISNSRFLPKPVNMDALQATIGELVDNNSSWTVL